MRKSGPNLQNIPIRRVLPSRRPLFHFRAPENNNFVEIEERVLDHLDREVADMLGITPTQAYRGGNG